MEGLQQYRAEIDRIDGELSRLFEERMAAAAEIAARKQALGLPVRDRDRERELLDRNAARIRNPALRPHYAALLQSLMAESRAWQRELMGGTASEALRVHTEDGGYPVYLEAGVLQKAASLLDLDRRVFLVTDDEIPTEYVAALAGQCRDCMIWSVPAGELAKSPEILTELLSAMLRAGLRRSDCVAALGGGVVCDLAGLAAALYMRGIDCYLFPTTLLAMVDAAVGGKTAVNLDGVKNAVGVFRQPGAVVMDPDTLGTLPPRQLASGLAEAVKMALTHDAALFARFEDPAGYGPIKEIIAACLRIKTAVVAADERDHGVRQALNFGHTLGHGIEAAADGLLLHGEAVALGMLPMCAPEVRARLVPVLERLGLPTYVNFDLDVDTAMEAIAHDKKTAGDGIEVVTVPAVGQYRFRSVGLNELRTMLLRLIQ